MANGTKTIQRAQSEIKRVLQRYRLNWNDVAPDLEEQNWKALKPLAKKIRRELFRKYYPGLYGSIAKKSGV